MRHLRLFVIAASFCLLSMSLSAQELFNWGYASAAGNSAQGTLTANLIHGSLTGQGEYQVATIGGNWDEAQITGLSTSYSVDNLFSYNALTGGFSVSTNGIGFLTANDRDVSFTGPTSNQNLGTEVVGDASSDLTSVRLSESPSTNAAPWEPSDALALTACAGLAFQQVRRRSKRRSAVLAG